MRRREELERLERQQGGLLAPVIETDAEPTVITAETMGKPGYLA